MIFSAVFAGVGYLLLRIQGSLPLNPQHFGQVTPALSLNTAISFLTNTNWQRLRRGDDHVRTSPRSAF